MISEQPRPWRKSCERESCYGDRVYVQPPFPKILLIVVIAMLLIVIILLIVVIAILLILLIVVRAIQYISPNTINSSSSYSINSSNSYSVTLGRPLGLLTICMPRIMQ